MLILEYSFRQGTCMARVDTLLKAFPKKVLEVSPTCKRPAVSLRQFQRIGEKMELWGLVHRVSKGHGTPNERWVDGDLDAVIERVRRCLARYPSPQMAHLRRLRSTTVIKRSREGRQEGPSPLPLEIHPSKAETFGDCAFSDSPRQPETPPPNCAAPPAPHESHGESNDMSPDRLFRSRWNAQPRRSNLQKLGTSKPVLADIQEILDKYGEEEAVAAVEAFGEAMMARSGGPYGLGYFKKWIVDYDPSVKGEPFVEKAIDFDLKIVPSTDPEDPRPAIVFDKVIVDQEIHRSRPEAVIDAWNRIMPDSARIIVPTAKLRHACAALDADPVFREHRDDILGKCARLARHPKFGGNVSLDWLLKEDRYAEILNGKYNSWLNDVPEEEEQIPPNIEPEKPYLYEDRDWSTMKPIHRAIVVHTFFRWDSRRAAARLGNLDAWLAIEMEVLKSFSQQPELSAERASQTLTYLGCSAEFLRERYWTYMNGATDPRVSGKLWSDKWEPVERDLKAGKFGEFGSLFV